MQKLLTCCFVLCFFQQVNAQNDWFNPSNEWTFHLTSGWVGEGIERIKPANDTLYAGQIWKKMDCISDFKNGGSVRHDRLLRQEGNKLYALANGTTPFLMYDFDLSVGDIVFLPMLGIFNSGFGYVIEDTSEIMVGTSLRKSQSIAWINIGATGGSTKGTFIQGIGYVLGTHLIGGVDCLADSYLFLDEPAGAISDGPERIFCSLSSDWGNFESLGHTFCEVLSTETTELPLYEVYPNPSNGQIYVQTESNETWLDVTLVDLSGQVLLHQGLSGSGSISTTYKGVAILQIHSSKGTGRRLIQIF